MSKAIKATKTVKVTIEQDKLEAFSGTLDGACDLIRLELHQRACDKAMIRELLDQLLDAWSYMYDPAAVCTNRAMHNVYGLYIKAKKAGDPAKAKAYLDCYKQLLADRQASGFDD